MKIATWNLERPDAIGPKSRRIIEVLTVLDADILVVTETNALLDLQGYHVFHSAALDADNYKDGERRVSIYSKYAAMGRIATFDEQTSICVTLLTPIGALAVYATIIGIYGNRRHDFNNDVDRQVDDFDRIAEIGNLCIAGDFNMSFSDNYYFTKIGRDRLNDCFSRNKLVNVTAGIPQNIDHVILAERSVAGRKLLVTTWNQDKVLSDHIGLCVEIDFD